MKKGKKILAAFLSVATALTAMTVSAFAADDSGAVSTSEVTVTYYASSSKPAAPSSIKVAKRTSSSIKLSWKKVSGASSYDLRYKVSGSSKWKTVTKIKGNAYTMRKLSDSTKYVFQIRSRTANGTVGKWSKAKSSTTSAKASSVSINPNSIPETPYNQFSMETDKDTEYYTIVKYNGYDKQVKIPSSRNGLNVTGIAYEAFMDNTSVEIIVIPDTIDFISSDVFTGCTNLKNIIVLGNNVTFRKSFGDCKATVTYNGKDYGPSEYSLLLDE